MFALLEQLKGICAREQVSPAQLAPPLLLQWSDQVGVAVRRTHKCPSSLSLLLLLYFERAANSSGVAQHWTCEFFFVLSEETKPKKAWLATTSPMKKPCRGWKTSLTSSGSTPSRQHAPLTLGKSIQSYVKWNDWISYSYRWSKSATCCNVDSRFYLRGPVHVLQIIPARWKM